MIEINSKVPVLGFAAYSGTGKTTLLVSIIPLLKKEGLEVGVIKHAHHNFEIDQPGKDSYELRKSGASQMLIGSKKRWALMVEKEETDQAIRLQEYISHLDQDKLDIILVEGFKPEALTKIEIHRPSLGHPLICKTDESIIAVAADDDLVEKPDVTILDLNNHESIAHYIINTFDLKKNKVANQ
jgi:molybdopterin-guanine dinucleotide biosynthesis protein MobB